MHDTEIVWVSILESGTTSSCTYTDYHYVPPPCRICGEDNCDGHALLHEGRFTRLVKRRK